VVVCPRRPCLGPSENDIRSKDCVNVSDSSSVRPMDGQ
jgi:hypothetical protein